MQIESFSDLYYYHDLFGDDLMLSLDEIIIEKPNEPVKISNISTQHKTASAQPSTKDNNIEYKTENEEESSVVLASQKSYTGEEKREHLKKFYIECLKNKPCPKQISNCPFIFGAGEVINLETVVIYPVARTTDKEKSKTLFNDPVGLYIKDILRKEGFNTEKMFFIPFVKTDMAIESLSPAVLKIHSFITLKQLEILLPKLVLVFGVTPGRILINSTSSDIRINTEESLHDLRNKRKLNKKNSINFVVSYDPDDIAKDSFKRNEFLSNDSVFMASLYRSLFY